MLISPDYVQRVACCSLERQSDANEQVARAHLRVLEALSLRVSLLPATDAPANDAAFKPTRRLAGPPDVMGDDAFERPATPEEQSQMGALAREALDAGAFGIASSRAANHVCIDGRPVPSYVADIAELETLGRALAEHGSGVMQIARGDLPVNITMAATAPR